MARVYPPETGRRNATRLIDGVELRGYFFAEDAIFELEITGPAKLLYLYLKRRANPGGASFPLVKTMADATGVSASTAKRARAELEKAGLLTVEEHFDRHGRNTANTYVVRSVREVRVTEGVQAEPLPGQAEPLGGQADLHKGSHSKDSQGKEEEKIVVVRQGVEHDDHSITGGSPEAEDRYAQLLAEQKGRLTWKHREMLRKVVADIGSCATLTAIERWFTDPEIWPSRKNNNVPAFVHSLPDLLKPAAPSKRAAEEAMMARSRALIEADQRAEVERRRCMLKLDDDATPEQINAAYEVWLGPKKESAA